MSYKPLYRLPTEPRTVTDDQMRWAEEWNTLADRVVKFFPGYRVAGMDPGIMLFAEDGKDDTVTLSLRACLSLLTNEDSGAKK